MAPVTVSAEFQKSFDEFKDYPRNLVPRGTNVHTSTLESYEARIDQADKDGLFVTDESMIEVQYREFISQTPLSAISGSNSAVVSQGACNEES